MNFINQCFINVVVKLVKSFVFYSKELHACAKILEANLKMFHFLDIEEINGNFSFKH